MFCCILTVIPLFCEFNGKTKLNDRIMTKPNIRSYHFDHHMRQKSENKNLDDNIKLWQDQG